MPALGQGTRVVDGQRNTFPTAAAWAPTHYGPETTGVPNVSPTLPPFIGANGRGSAGGVTEGVNGYGTAGNNAQATQAAADNPHSLELAPTWWAIIALVGGLVLLRATAWRNVIEAGAQERVGAERAEARAEA